METGTLSWDSAPRRKGEEELLSVHSEKGKRLVRLSTTARGIEFRQDWDSPVPSKHGKSRSEADRVSPVGTGFEVE